jgi:uncharacterized protein YbcI
MRISDLRWVATIVVDCDGGPMRRGSRSAAVACDGGSMRGASMSETEFSQPMRDRLAGGKLLAEITNRLVALMREHCGRGPIKAKTYVLDNLIVCVLSNGFTAIERTMIEGGEPDRVLDMRRDFQRLMKVRYSEMIEELTGRKVLAFLSQAHVEPDLTIEIFLMEGVLPGFGAIELVDSGDDCATAPRDP